MTKNKVNDETMVKSKRDRRKEGPDVIRRFSGILRCQSSLSIHLYERNNCIIRYGSWDILQGFFGSACEKRLKRTCYESNFSCVKVKGEWLLRVP